MMGRPWLLLLLLSLVCNRVSKAFVVPTRRAFLLVLQEPFKASSSGRYLSDWSDFQYMDDDLLDDDIDIDKTDYAKEEDSQEHKAQVGSSLQAPDIEMDAPPILVPQGTILEFTQDNVLGILSACREEIGTLFGYSAENRGVGITGGVDFVELDGPVVVLKLKGRFWHERTTVLNRVKAYLIGRIPEIIDVIVEDEYQLTQEANEEF